MRSDRFIVLVTVFLFAGLALHCTKTVYVKQPIRELRYIRCKLPALPVLPSVKFSKGCLDKKGQVALLLRERYYKQWIRQAIAACGKGAKLDETKAHRDGGVGDSAPD